VARRGNPARLVIALSVAGVLAIFLIYTSAFGGGTPALSPSKLPGHHGRVSVVGKVTGQPGLVPTALFTGGMKSFYEYARKHSQQG
jgi:hypothetical protein